MSDRLWPTAADWLAGGTGDPARADLVVAGVPLSVTSITQPSGMHETPAAIRARLARLSTYHSERDVDVVEVAVHDAGDLGAQPSDAQIGEAARKAAAHAPLAVLLGGDNAVTFGALAGMAGDGLDRWGLVTLDAHHDVRAYDGRPGNGSPVRALIDAGLPGTHVVQIGIAGFSNSAAYRRWCGEAGIDVITSAEARSGGVGDTIAGAFERLAAVVDHIYVDLDVDVLDPAFAPGCPGARPGGLAPADLCTAAFLSGAHPKVVAVDIVEVDTTTDVGHRTVDVAALCLLNAAAGLTQRLR
ncbi:MAG: arginase family protein [Acidimicrobiia bacterium]